MEELGGHDDGYSLRRSIHSLSLSADYDIANCEVGALSFWWIGECANMRMSGIMSMSCLTFQVNMQLGVTISCQLDTDICRQTRGNHSFLLCRR